MKSYEENYNSRKEKIEKYTTLIRLINILSTIYIVGNYIYLLLINRRDKDKVLKIILGTGISFAGCSLIRRLINRQRPYEKYNIEKLINKKKEGRSFPSRHVFSAALISTYVYFENKRSGILCFFVTMIIGIIRIISGVHYVSDVVAGYILGVVSGIPGKRL